MCTMKVCNTNKLAMWLEEELPSHLVSNCESQKILYILFLIKVHKMQKYRRLSEDQR